MKLVLRGSSTLNISSEDDLGKIIPRGFKGRVLNYGQGEGQIEIADLVWGVYVGPVAEYQLVLEEGACELGPLKDMVNAVVETIGSNFQIVVTPIVDGTLTASG